MADTTLLPFVDETRYLKCYAAAACGANLVLVPDASNARGVRLPTAGEVIKSFAGVTQRAIAAGAEGEVIGLSGDVAVCTAYGTIAKGDRVYVSSVTAHLGQVKKFTGVKTDGAQLLIGVALDDTSDGSLVSVRIDPRRVSEGMQSGMATLSGGTITVTGVRISGTTCRILVTSNTPGGVAGFLSAPSASRSAAGSQFVINSSTNADTCTADWLVIDDD